MRYPLAPQEHESSCARYTESCGVSCSLCAPAPEMRNVRRGGYEIVDPDILDYTGVDSLSPNVLWYTSLVSALVLAASAVALVVVLVETDATWKHSQASLWSFLPSLGLRYKDTVTVAWIAVAFQFLLSAHYVTALVRHHSLVLSLQHSGRNPQRWLFWAPVWSLVYVYGSLRCGTLLISEIWLQACLVLVSAVFGYLSEPDSAYVLPAVTVLGKTNTAAPSNPRNHSLFAALAYVASLLAVWLQVTCVYSVSWHHSLLSSGTYAVYFVLTLSSILLMLLRLNNGTSKGFFSMLRRPLTNDLLHTLVFVATCVTLSWV